MAALELLRAAPADAAPPEAVPPGYERLVPPPGFVQHIGEFFLHAQQPVLATRVRCTHVNTIRIAHGGFLATLADSAFGVVLRRELGLPVPPATVTLNLDYLSAAREGDWLEAHVQTQKAGRQLINATCLLKTGERLVMRATGIFITPQAQRPLENPSPRGRG